MSPDGRHLSAPQGLLGFCVSAVVAGITTLLDHVPGAGLPNLEETWLSCSLRNTSDSCRRNWIFENNYNECSRSRESMGTDPSVCVWSWEEIV